MTGSKQSGTALWLQILMAAGLPPFGLVSPSAPPGERHGDAEGAFEASLRQGIYYATNPSPTTGQYVFPEAVVRHVAEVFPFGVTRTDLAFIEKVVVTIRPIREYVAAMRRLYALEAVGADDAAPVRLDPSLEWWAENHALVKDASIRRYPVRFETQDHLLRDSDALIAEVVGWLGAGNPARAADTVKPRHRRFESADDLSIDPEAAAVCDELYETLDQRRALSPAFLSKLDETHRSLLPKLHQEQVRVSSGAPRASR